jgi:hypothetical protein
MLEGSFSPPRRGSRGSGTQGMVVVIAWRGQGGARWREGGVLDLPARRGAGCGPVALEMRARASCFVLYVLRTTVPLASGSRRGRVVLLASSTPPAARAVFPDLRFSCWT